LSVNINN